MSATKLTKQQLSDLVTQLEGELSMSAKREEILERKLKKFIAVSNNQAKQLSNSGATRHDILVAAKAEAMRTGRVVTVRLGDQS